MLWSMEEISLISHLKTYDKISKLATGQGDD